MVIEADDLISNVLSMDKRKKFIYDLYSYSGKQPFFITEIERFYGWNNPQQDIRKVISSLISIGIFFLVDEIKGDSRYKLNKKLLNNLIRQCECFKLNGRHIEATCSVYSY